MINKFYLLCVIFSGSPDLTLKTCLVQLMARQSVGQSVGQSVSRSVSQSVSQSDAVHGMIGVQWHRRWELGAAKKSVVHFGFMGGICVVMTS